MRRAFTLLLLLAIGAAAWYQRDTLLGVWDGMRGCGGGAAPGPDLADAAQAKLAGLTTGGDRARVALSEAEVQSLLLFRMASLLPAYIVSPRVELRSGRIRLNARIPIDAFPRVDELGDMVGFLPDTTDVAVAGQLIPLDDGRVGFAVDELSAARIPLPRGLIPKVLQRLGRRDEPGLPPDALAFPLPAGARAAYVRGDSLVFVTRPASD